MSIRGFDNGFSFRTNRLLDYNDNPAQITGIRGYTQRGRIGRGGARGGIRGRGGRFDMKNNRILVQHQNRALTSNILGRNRPISSMTNNDECTPVSSTEPGCASGENNNGGTQVQPLNAAMHMHHHFPPPAYQSVPSSPTPTRPTTPASRTELRYDIKECEEYFGKVFNLKRLLAYILIGISILVFFIVLLCLTFL